MPASSLAEEGIVEGLLDFLSAFREQRLSGMMGSQH